MKASVLPFKFIKTTLIWAFLLGVIFTSCGKKDSTPPPPPADKTSLQAAIVIAQALNDNTVEGTKPGQYEVGNKAALTAALTASKTVAADASATQATVNNTIAQLNAAIAAYQGHLIKEIAAANLVGYWKMNGNANDSSGNGNNGVLTAGHAFFGAGTPATTNDRFGRAGMAYHFDMGGNIDIPYKASLNPAEMSISVWVKWSSAGRVKEANSYYIIAMNRWNGYKFQLQDTHLPFYTVKVKKTTGGDSVSIDRSTGDGYSIAENTWRHLVVTYKSGTESFYIDGDLVKTWDATSGPDAPPPGTTVTLVNPIDLVIGADLPTDKYLTVDATGNFLVDYGGFWTGDLDDVMLYNVALEGPQVKSIFTNQSTL